MRALAKSSQEWWIGLLGLMDFLVERGEDWAFDFRDWKEEVMERGEMAEEDFRQFLKDINRKKTPNPTAQANGNGSSPEEVPALEQTRANPLRQALKHGQIQGGQEEASEVLEKHLDQALQHLEP